MRLALPSFTAPRRHIGGWIALALVALGALALALATAMAQVAGERGIAPVASSSDVEVSGIEVDVRGSSAREAREKGWAIAQKKAWEKLGGPRLSDDRIAAMVSAVVIERESIAPRRYIARLGVVFDRSRASRYLGGEAAKRASAPLLLIPVMHSAGASVTFERRNAWQRAWAEFNPGLSRIDYVRPVGGGGESLLLNFGQTTRRSRVWWRNILDEFAASGVLIAHADLRHRYPGGPIEGVFTARHGPDATFLDQFTLKADGPEALGPMLAEAVRKFDSIYTSALEAGKLRLDPSIDADAAGANDPAIARLLEIARAIEARERGEIVGAAGTPSTASPGAPIEAAAVDEAASSQTQTARASVQVASYAVQFASPDAQSFDRALRDLRSVPGVRSAGIASTAIGGVSVANVRYQGSLDQLAAALSARGYSVQKGAGALSIRR